MNRGNICEIFNSIQGEGRETGMPATFIRFNRCNKSCSFCDTCFMEKGNIEENFLSNIIFTGGEPFLFKEDILSVINKHPDKKFFGETNGAIFDEELSKLVTWTVSPKSKDDLNNTKRLLESNANNYLKLVYGVSDFDELFNSLEKFKTRMYIQPLTKEDNFLNLQETLEFVTLNNVFISSRLHLLWRLK